MVASSAIGAPLQLGLQAGQQPGMDAGIDLLAQNLLSALDGQHGYLRTQRFARLHHLLLPLRPFSPHPLLSLLPAPCPLTASRACTSCCSASARAAATSLLPSSVARALASSMMAWARRSASASRAAVSLR